MANQTACNKELSQDDIRVATKDRLPASMQDEMQDKDKDYSSLKHEEWCDLMYTTEAKDNRKRSADQI